MSEIEALDARIARTPYAKAAEVNATATVVEEVIRLNDAAHRSLVADDANLRSDVDKLAKEMEDIAVVMKAIQADVKELRSGYLKFDAALGKSGQSGLASQVLDSTQHEIAAAVLKLQAEFNAKLLAIEEEKLPGLSQRLNARIDSLQRETQSKSTLVDADPVEGRKAVVPAPKERMVQEDEALTSVPAQPPGPAAAAPVPAHDNDADNTAKAVAPVSRLRMDAEPEAVDEPPVPAAFTKPSFASPVSAPAVPAAVTEANGGGAIGKPAVAQQKTAEPEEDLEAADATKPSPPAAHHGEAIPSWLRKPNAQQLDEDGDDTGARAKLGRDGAGRPPLVNPPPTEHEQAVTQMQQPVPRSRITTQQADAADGDGDDTLTPPRSRALPRDADAGADDAAPRTPLRNRLNAALPRDEEEGGETVPAAKPAVDTGIVPPHILEKLGGLADDGGGDGVDASPPSHNRLPPSIVKPVLTSPQAATAAGDGDGDEDSVFNRLSPPAAVKAATAPVLRRDEAELSGQQHEDAAPQAVATRTRPSNRIRGNVIVDGA